MANVLGFTLYILLSAMLNFEWMLTSIAIALSMIVLLIYYWIYMHFHNSTSIAALIGIVIAHTYGCYFSEKILKESFLQLH